MAWENNDNKWYRGKHDRIRVSLTEDYEVEYFIDAYLKRRSADVTHANRTVIANKMEDYPGRAPIMRDALNTWLDGIITVNR